MRRALLTLLSAAIIGLLPAAAAHAAATPATLSFTVPAGWSARQADGKLRELLGRMLGMLQADNTLQMMVTGYTDSLGTADENLSIGYYYAERVGRELTALGIPKARIHLSSEGEASPVKAGGGFAEQAENRRVMVTMSAAPATSLATAAQRAAGGKKVFITEPTPGRTDRAYQKVKAIVEGGARTALLTVNGVSQIVPVNNSRVEGEAVLDRGANSIEVTVWDETGATGKDRVDLEYQPPPPRVAIETPRNGEEFDTTESPVIRVRGNVSFSAPLQETFLFLNGAPRRIEVGKDGSFDQPLVLIQEQNALRVEALDIFGKVATSEEIKVRSTTLSPKELVVFLTWDSMVDADLHVFGPDGKHTWWQALDTFHGADAIPGGTLDLDNKVGYGPEVFSLTAGKQGVYSIEVGYWHSAGGEPTEAQVTVVLHPADPARRVVRVFGPRVLAPGDRDRWQVVRIRMPEYLFDDR
jgi:uncharacterized protein YfaP (DUF2135 family)